MCGCRRGGRVRLRESGWTVVQCGGCDLLQTWPRPAAAATASLYDTDDYYESRAMAAQAGPASRARVQAIIAAIGRQAPTVLDVGAGQGHLVQAFRVVGVHAEGVEPSPAGRAAARKLYGLELSDALPEGSDGKYALVTMIHSLEHTRDPIAALEAVRPLLRPDGMIYIEVPNAASVEVWLPRRRRQIFDLPAHLFHFVPRTLSRVVERSGLRVQKIGLSNSVFVERALEIQARARAGLSPQRWARPDLGLAPLGHDAGDGERHRRTWWSQGVLPAVRRALPGWKFHLVAARRE